MKSCFLYIVVLIFEAVQLTCTFYGIYDFFELWAVSLCDNVPCNTYVFLENLNFYLYQQVKKEKNYVMTKPIGLGNMSSSFNDFNVFTS